MDGARAGHRTRPDRRVGECRRRLGVRAALRSRARTVSPLLQVRGLHIASAAGTIVDRLDLDLAAGETIGIVGESGSGKSLTAKAVIGLLPPGVDATGSVRFDERELLATSERQLRR